MGVTDQSSKLQALTPRGCEPKNICKKKQLEQVSGTMRGAAALVVHKGDSFDDSGNAVATETDPYNTQHEKEFRKRMLNKKVLVPPGGFTHPDAPLVHCGGPPPSSPRPTKRPATRSSSVGPRLETTDHTASRLSGA